MLNPRLLLLVVLLGFGGCEGGDAAGPNRSVEQAVAHYATVERELLAASTKHLSPARLEQRARLIRELADYRERRDFTVNEDFPGARVPYFVDARGRRCAVAHLLHRFGEDALVAEVAATDNHAYVSDLADQPELLAWLDQVGLTPWEAARIQVPGTVPPREEERTRDPNDPLPSETPRMEPTENTPPGSGEDGPVTAPGSSAGPPSAGPVAGSGLTRPGPGGRPGTRRASAGHGVDSWWLWWELNKLDYLTANPLRMETGPVTGDTSPEAAAKTRERLIEQHRMKVLPTLLAALKHEDARVRAAAAVAAGRVGGDSALTSLLALLSDPQQLVRERAILALGATGSPSAAAPLLSLARTGTHLAHGGGQVAPDARPLAVVALGLLRQSGVEGDFDEAVATMVANCKKRELEDLGLGMLLHGILAPGPRIADLTGKLARDRNTPDPVRARALEQLAAGEGARSLRTLQQALAGSRLELRRSAATALGEVEHDLVLPRLMTAYELEEEPLTRGFLLLAMAGRGGEKATRFITGELAEGPGALRPWAALALGLRARQGDQLALAALDGTELSGLAQGAVWIARGLAGDAEAVPELRDALGERGSPRVRSQAATALALIGNGRARHALLSRLETEPSPAVRVWIAQCIGLLGHDEDADLLIRALEESTRPEHAGVLAVGLAFHGGAETLAGLEELIAGEGLDPVVRATAITAVGLMLDRRPGLEFPALSRRTNYAAAPSWLFPILLSTL